MPRLIGPYARQLTPWKLKFWFALVTHHDGVKRYEVAIDKHERVMKARSRPVYEGKVPPHRSNFAEYALPSPKDLKRFPAIKYPRHKGDTIAAAATSMLTGTDVADFARLRLIGELPNASRPAPTSLPLDP